MSEQNEQKRHLRAEAAGSPAEDLVTVGVFPDPMTANLARTELEAAGIASFLQGENANNLIPIAFLAQLQVRPEDEAAAREVLRAPDDAPESVDEVTAAEIATEGGQTSNS
jgi:hypothetical protein